MEKYVWLKKMISNGRIIMLFIYSSPWYLLSWQIIMHASRSSSLKGLLSLPYYSVKKKRRESENHAAQGYKGREVRAEQQHEVHLHLSAVSEHSTLLLCKARKESFLHCVQTREWLNCAVYLDSSRMWSYKTFLADWWPTILTKY